MKTTLMTFVKKSTCFIFGHWYNTSYPQSIARKYAHRAGFVCDRCGRQA